MSQDKTRIFTLLFFSPLFFASCGNIVFDAVVRDKSGTGPNGADLDSDTGSATDADTDVDRDSASPWDTDSTATSHCEGPIVFPDAALEQAVRMSIEMVTGHPIEGDLVPDDVATLTWIGGGPQVISDLTGIECLTGLTEVIFAGNNISDITPLSNLHNLFYLELDANQISDISPLGGLTALTTIGLSENQILDISPLGGLENLDMLILDNNQISDISVLSGLDNLGFLSLGNNEISDISPLVENSGLGEYDVINITGNPLDCDDPATIEAILLLYDRVDELEQDCAIRIPN